MYSKPVFRPPRSMRLFSKEAFAAEPSARSSDPNLRPTFSCPSRPTCPTRPTRLTSNKPLLLDKIPVHF